MRKALCVGINHYQYGCDLDCAANDAASIGNVLEKHANGDPNFKVTYLTSQYENELVSKADLLTELENLFSEKNEIALFYFAGHGVTDRYGGYLCTSDTNLRAHNMGLPLEDLMKIVSESPAENKIIILDSCHSGSAGDFAVMPLFTFLPKNTMIFAACRNTEEANEFPQYPGLNFPHHGFFTYLLLDALNGAGANVLGEVDITNVYSHIEKSFFIPEQRPVFKANIDSSLCIRQAAPKMAFEDLKQILAFFPTPFKEYALTPAYEEDKRDVEDKTHYPEKEELFRILRKFYQMNLVVPVGEEYMYWAAVRSKSCKLTPLGQFYWYQIQKLEQMPDSPIRLVKPLF